MADFNFDAPRKIIEFNLSSFQGSKICDSSVSSGADEVTGLMEVSGSFRELWRVKDIGPSGAGLSGAGSGLKVPIQCPSSWVD